jgi:UDPglucose 6-dehydrogenase
VITVNNRQRLLPLYALRERFGELCDVRIAILGLAFKPDTDDVREAPSLDLIRALADEDANITAYDPKAREAAKKVLPGSIRLTDDLLDCVNGAQALVLLTEWREIVDSDWATIAEQMNSPRFLFDGRNAVDPEHARHLGFQYQGVGRARTLAAADLQISEDSSLPQTSAGSGNVDPTQGFANP